MSSPSSRLMLSLVAALALASGCRKKATPPAPPPDPCAGEAPSKVELRTQEGALVVRLRAALVVPAAPGGPPVAAAAEDVVCDGNNALVGRLQVTTSPRGVALRDGKGAVVASVTGPAQPGGDATLVAGGRTLRLLDQGLLMRLLDGQGVPVGQLGQLKDRGVAFTGGGKPVATAEREAAGAEKRVIHAPDGSLTHFMTGVGDDRAAAAFSLDGLGLAERFVLSRYLDVAAP